MSIVLTGYRIKIKSGHIVKRGVARPGEYAETIAAIRADGYKGKICPQYTGKN